MNCIKCCFNGSGVCLHPEFEDDYQDGVEIPDGGVEYRPAWCPLEDE